MEWFVKLPPHVQITLIVATAFTAVWGIALAALVAVCNARDDREAARTGNRR